MDYNQYIRIFKQITDAIDKCQKEITIQEPQYISKEVMSQLLERISTIKSYKEIDSNTYVFNIGGYQ